MKKSITILYFILSILLAALILPACTTGASQPLPPVTVTVTATATTTATATVPAVIPSPSSSASPAAPITKPVATTPIVTPTASPVQVDVNNNPHFFIGKDIGSFTTPTVLSGAPNPSAVYRDTYLDLDLGGYFTNRDAFFSPRIPKITDHDDWFYIFELPVYKMPWILNWGYTTKSNSPDTSVSLAVYKKDDFINLYNKYPGTATISKVGVDRGISDSGVHCMSFNDVGSFVVLVRTNNAADIVSWWAKYGGQKYG